MIACTVTVDQIAQSLLGQWTQCWQRTGNKRPPTFTNKLNKRSKFLIIYPDTLYFFPRCKKALLRVNYRGGG